jgi:hypothetical protein
MRLHPLPFPHALLIALILPLTTQAQDQGGWVSLFDGESLDGWTVRGGFATYEVEDGAIVGTTGEGSPNTFLCKGDSADFELEFEVKLDDPRLNSGVQVRSHVYGEGSERPGVVYGPQCEVARNETGTAGRFYDEGRRGQWLAEINPEAEDAFEDDGWNRYRIVVQGDRYRSWVNGVAASDFTDDLDDRGFIGSRSTASRRMRGRIGSAGGTSASGSWGRGRSRMVRCPPWASNRSSTGETCLAGRAAPNSGRSRTAA